MTKTPASVPDDECTRRAIRMQGHIREYVRYEPPEAIVVNSPKSYKYKYDLGQTVFLLLLIFLFFHFRGVKREQP